MVAAEKLEFDGIRRHVPTRVLHWRLDFAAASEDGRFAFVANGPGRFLATEATVFACNHLSVNKIVSTGFCGGLKQSLKIGAIVIANRVKSGSDATYSAYSPIASPLAETGTVVSSDRVAVTTKDKQHLALEGAIAVEMEAAGVAAEAQRRGLPFYCIRAVSDTSAEDMPLDFNRFRDTAGRFDRRAIAMAAIVKPFQRVPGLMRLQRNCRVASARLGEFFVNCQF